MTTPRGQVPKQRRRTGGKAFTALLAFSLALAVVAAPPIGSSSSANASVFAVEAPNDPVLLGSSDATWEDASSIADYQPKEYPGSMYWVAQEVTGAGEYWNDGYIGKGVDVALIDSGVVPVKGLKRKGTIVNGADLSFESQAENLLYLDTYGHGTHLAGIIAGRDNAARTVQKGTDKHFLGMAPGARILNVKVADSHGVVDVSQVIAAIDWVVQHRNDKGMNIRVLSLSFGTDGKQDYRVDPLAFAVEQAWQAGIVVVVAAGNDGNASPLRNPAYDPFVIAVGAADGNETYDANDDAIAQFSSCGTPDRHVDVVAPGKSIVSLRNPGSYIDQQYPEAVVADRYFLGSGTSQAAAVVAGAAALIIDQRPGITPDQVKALLTSTAQRLDGVSTRCQGAGMIDLKTARDTETPTASQTWTSSAGTGSLELARGSNHVVDQGIALVGEQDIFGNPWDGASWSQASAAGASWSGGDWNGASWSGASWSGASWSGASWSGASWSGGSWSGASWAGASWSGASWSGGSWSGASWD